MIGDIENRLTESAARFDGALEALLPVEEGDRLNAAMRYAVLGGGKRLRPFVLVSAADLFGVSEHHALGVACALECVHAYSLVHDDLPAMDDDDLRRGRPTVHRAYDEATAILAGDGLLTLAFDILARPETHPVASVRAELVLELARAAGRHGMIGGQMADLAAEGRFTETGRPLALDEAAISHLHELKTGALFRFAAEAGAMLAERGGEDRARLARFGKALGLAFQVADDLLDEEATAEQVGKATAKDRERGKATFVNAGGPDAARRRLDALVAEAEGALAAYGSAAETLRAAARFAAIRRR